MQLNKHAQKKDQSQWVKSIQFLLVLQILK